MCALTKFFRTFWYSNKFLCCGGHCPFKYENPAYTLEASLKVIHNPTLSFKLSTTYFAYLVNIFGLSRFRNPPFSANQTGLVKCQSVIIGSIPLSLKALTTLI